MATKPKKKNWLTSLLSPTPKFFIQKTNETQTPYSGRGPKTWILSRALCGYRYFSLPSNVKGTKRFNLIQLQMRTASPYLNTRSFAHWTDQGVSIWFWDQDIVTRALEDQNLPKNTLVYPETAFQDPLEKGMRLVQVSEGFEGQIWENKGLVASRWWNEYPDEAEWLQFWRAAGQASLGYSSQRPDAPQSGAYLDKTWAHTRPIAGGFTLESLYSREAFSVLALLLALPLSFYGGQVLNDYIALTNTEHQIEALEPGTKKIEIERKAAELNLDKINKILSLDPFPNPVTLLAKIVQKLDQSDIKITDYRFNRDMINLTLTGETQPDAAKFVALMESIPEFDQVNTDPGFMKNTLRVSLKVKKLWN